VKYYLWQEDVRCELTTTGVYVSLYTNDYSEAIGRINVMLCYAMLYHVMSKSMQIEG
jgi:hypothetical protein